MRPDWSAPELYPAAQNITPLGWLRVVLRGVPVVLTLIFGLGVLLLLRLLERPLFGLARPWTPRITRIVCRLSLILMGIRFETQGQPMQDRGAIVSNHVSWLDILVLNARKTIYFVAKSEVAGWPGIGWLARATGTVFIARDRSRAADQVEEFRTRLSLGHKLLFFPEGTSSDGRRIMPFKSTLFAAFFAPELRDMIKIQPVSVAYFAPRGQDARFYGWWGDMELAPSLLQVLAVRPQGRVRVTYHAPVRVTDFSDRKTLAQYCETVVRGGLQAELGPDIV